MSEAPSDLIRRHRRTLKLSQLALATSAGTTQRHLSFIESGRAKPGRDLLLRLAGALNLSMGARNRLFMAAGLLPALQSGTLDQSLCAAVRDAAQRLIDQHVPYPGMVLDGGYNVLTSNRPLDRLLSMIAPLDELWARVSEGHTQRNLLRLTFHPQGLVPLMREPERWVPSQWQRIANDAVCAALLQEISGWSHMVRWMRAHRPHREAPALLERYVFKRQHVDLLSFVATLGAPADADAASFKVNLLFPANEETDYWMRSLESTDKLGAEAV